MSIMTSIESLRFREASAADVAAMALCHLDDPNTPAPDSRIAGYLDGIHHPQQALRPRIAYVALVDDVIVGYTAGHRTTRHDCEGELQCLFVSPKFRRQGIATELLKLLARWFESQNARKVCVALAGDSPPEAQPFCDSAGAVPLKKYWYAWEDITTVNLRRTA